jgi:penicillin-binding protein 1A
MAHGPRRPRGLVILSLLLATLVALALLAAVVLGGLVLWHGRDLPPLDRATRYDPVQSLRVFTADGVEIAQFGAERRQFVPIAQMPQRLKDAVLAVEDAGFYDHEGISWKGLLRAVVANTTGGLPQGASTITQQVARTMFLSNRRTAERKIKEALLARRLEAELSKDQILELYMNQIFLGNRSYGFAAASQVYFGKPLGALSVAEVAMLAGLPQNPIWANPVANLERATRRQRIVLSRMLATGKITQAEHDSAREQKLTIRRPTHVDVHAEHVAEMARRAVFERLGEAAYRDGVRVVTSLRADEQRAAHAALRRALMAHELRQPWRGPEGQEDLPAVPQKDEERAAAQALRDTQDDEDLRAAIVLQANTTEVSVQLASGERLVLQGEALRRVGAGLSPQAPARLAIRRGAVLRVAQETRARGQSGWVITQWPEAEGAFVSLEPSTGRITALVGGFEFNRRQFNHATQAQRQPGSAFKPFLYSAALELGIGPETVVLDAPLRTADGGVPSWDPKNSDGRFDGPLTLRQALAKSKNLVSVRVLQQVGLATAREWAQRFGFAPEALPEDLTLALGSGSTTPLKLAAAYAVLANGGYRIEPLLIEKITDASGSVLFEAPPAAPPAETERVIPARNAFLTRSLMAEVTRSGTAARAGAALQRQDIGGKTGTTNDSVDAWFAGIHRNRAAVAWIGHDEPKSLGVGESGGGLALPVWIEAMQRALRGMPQLPDPAPEGLLFVGSEWRYAEWADGGFVRGIGVEPPAPEAAPQAAAEPASAPR